MLTLSIDLDVSSNGPVRERTVAPGTIFPVSVLLEDDGQAPSPSEFDTVIVEILFNDSEQVLSVDPVQQPVAGDLAEHGTTGVDAFTRRPVKVMRAEELAVGSREMTALIGSQLTLRLPPAADPTGRYSRSTGRAGLHAQNRPFTLVPGIRRTVAMGKAAAGIEAVKAGTSHIVAVGTVLRGNEPLPVRSVVGTVTVA
jgi:hypothetical protein